MPGYKRAWTSLTRSWENLPKVGVTFCLVDLAGWLCERRSNLSTKLYSLAHQERQLPLTYSSDSCQDDLPYWIPSPTKKGGLLMIPFSYDTSDLRFNMKGSGWASPKDWFEHLVRSVAV